MLKISLILLVICVQVFFTNCYTVNHVQRNLYSDFDVEPTDEYLASLLHWENLYRNDNLPIIKPDQTDDHSHTFQKRGRQCLWKVCSWALDKRSAPSKFVY